MSEKDKDINRRKCLKNIGVTSSALLGSSTFIGSATASPINSIEELNGKEEDNVISKSKKTTEYKVFQYALKKEGYELSQSKKDAFSISLNTEVKFKVACFSFDTERQDVSVEFGIPLSDQSPRPATATVTRKDSDEYPVQITTYSVKGDRDLTQSSEVNATSNSTVSRSVSEVQTEEATVVKDSSDLSEAKEDGLQFSTSAYGDCEKSIDEMPCWACKDAVSVCNVMGCGTYTWLICGAAAFPTGGMGGLACGVIVGAICWAILHYGTTNPTTVCQNVCACP